MVCSHWSSFSTLHTLRHMHNSFIPVISVACRSETPAQVCFFPLSRSHSFYNAYYLEKLVSLLSVAWVTISIAFFAVLQIINLVTGIITKTQQMKHVKQRI